MHTTGIVRDDRGDWRAQRSCDFHRIVVVPRVMLIEQQRQTTFGLVQQAAQCLEQLCRASQPNEVGARDHEDAMRGCQGCAVGSGDRRASVERAAHVGNDKLLEVGQLDGEAQPIGWSTMAVDDLQVAVGQGIEATQVALGQVGGDAHERIALFGGEQARRLGYHAARSVEKVKAGTGTGLPNLSQ
jgi:hypothetical protein